MAMNKVLQGLLHLKDPPRRTAIAFGTGIFIAFSPLLGLHTLMAIAVAFAFRLNRVAVLTGAWINFWALIPCYMFGTFVGALLLGVDSSHLNDAVFDQAEALVSAAQASMLVGEWSQGFKSIGMVLRLFGPLLWPFLMGNTLLGLAAGFVAYVLARRFLEARAKRHALADGPEDSTANVVETVRPPDEPPLSS